MKKKTKNIIYLKDYLQKKQQQQQEEKLPPLDIIIPAPEHSNERIKKRIKILHNMFFICISLVTAAFLITHH